MGQIIFIVRPWFKATASVVQKVIVLNDTHGSTHEHVICLSGGAAILLAPSGHINHGDGWKDHFENMIKLFFDT